jgi:predicted nucleic acid-binding protein
VTAPDPFAGPAVIDASVGLNWLLPEPGAAAALHLRSRLVEGGVAVYVPDLFWAEAANVLWRLTRSGAARLEAIEARELLEVLRAAPLSTEPVGSVAGRALEIACETGVTAYDATYVAVAELRRARLWTADRRLVAALGGTPWGGLVSHVGV